MGPGELVWSIIRDEPLVLKGIAPGGSRDNYLYKLENWGADRWKYERNEGVGIGPMAIAPLRGEASTLEQAKTTLEHDWEGLQRLYRWVNYLLNNDPPTR